MRSRLIVALLSFVSLSCQWDLTQPFCHPSVEERVAQSLSGEPPAPEPPDVHPDQFCFAVFGDPQVHSDLEHRLGQFRQDIQTRGIDFFCVLGDITHDATGEEIATIEAALDSTNIPCYPTIGNHDLYQSEGWERFKQTFGPATYSVLVANRLKLIFIDTAEGRIGPTQFDWLESELADAEGLATIVGTHIPAFESPKSLLQGMASDTERHKLQHLLQKYDVWALVAGHFHGWRHIVVGSVHHFSCGTMAPGKLDSGKPGYLLFTWREGSLVWEKIDF